MVVTTRFGRCRPLQRLALLLAIAVPLLGQTGAVAKPSSATDPATSISSPSTLQPVTTPHSLSAREVREAQITVDTQRLYELAQQLKVELDKSTKDTLSIAVVKKAAEIEKLAHSISERMKSN